MDFNSKKIDVLSVGYYADFSRFFDLIAKSTKKLNPNLSFQHINLHLSGQVYSLLHRQRAFYLPCQAQRTVKESLTVEDEDAAFYRQFIQYHVRLVPEIAENKLIAQAKKYFIFLKDYLEKTQPKIILLSGDSRMPAEIIRFLAMQMGIKIMYFEQAPLGRTILDPNGVNANCSFRDPENIISYIEPANPVTSTKRKKWSGYKKYRAIDILIERFLPAFQPIEHKRPVRTPVGDEIYQSAVKKSATASDLSGKKTFLLVLQVPDDVNMVYHSPWFSNHVDIVKAVYQALPEKSALIVREHPLYKRLYESSLYTFIRDNKNVFFDHSESLIQAINECDIVIVNNSTVGLESIELGKMVVVLGNAYYDQSDFCIKYHGENLDGLLRSALEKPLADHAERHRYLSFLFNDKFIDGHFRDVEGPAPDSIAKWINNHVV